MKKVFQTILITLTILLFAFSAVSCEEAMDMLGSFTSGTSDKDNENETSDEGGENAENGNGGNVENSGNGENTENGKNEDGENTENGKNEDGENNKNGTSYTCYCGGGTGENGGSWMHAVCAICERFVCEHEICVDCNDFLVCGDICSDCKNHVCYHTWYYCSHCGGHSWYHTEPEWHGNRDHFTLCEVCGLHYLCELYNLDKVVECEKNKSCPECGEQDKREEHLCDDCGGYVCDGSDGHFTDCVHCGTRICRDDKHHNALCETCGTALCIGTHSSCSADGSGTVGGNGGNDNACYHIPAEGTLIFFDEVEASCFLEGNVAYYVCSVCGGYFIKDGEMEVERQEVYLIKLSHTDNDLNNSCDACGTCLACGEVGAHGYCTYCGSYACTGDHNSCGDGLGGGGYIQKKCTSCGNSYYENDFHEACGLCLKECCKCNFGNVCSHSDYTALVAGCEVNFNYSHGICNLCEEIIYIIYDENGMPSCFVCTYCVKGAPSCNHTYDGLTESYDSGCQSAAVHYYCAVCCRYFTVDEASTSYYVECTYCGVGEEYVTCGMCAEPVEDLCSYCNCCESCCTCEDRSDYTQYCPRCQGSSVDCTEGFEPTCMNHGIHSVYYCNDCSYRYVIENGAYTEYMEEYIPPIGHVDENSDSLCDNCGMLYNAEICVFCGEENVPYHGCGIEMIYETAVRPIRYSGVIKNRFEDGIWVKIEFIYDENNGNATLRYSVKQETVSCDYVTLITVVGSASRVTDYVVEFVPAEATLYAKNHLDYINGVDKTDFVLDTSAVSLFMFSSEFGDWGDGDGVTTDNYMVAALNLPFKVCESCYGLLDAGWHGVCTEDGCGKNRCSGHIHGVCDHENYTYADFGLCGAGDHYLCNDCQCYLSCMYDSVGNSILIVCDACKSYSESEGC